MPGEVALEPWMVAAVDDVLEYSMNAHTDLTPRVREVLKLLADGMSNKEIARVMHITDGTVKDHVSLALRRLCLKNRVQLAVWALRQEPTP